MLTDRALPRRHMPGSRRSVRIAGAPHRVIAPGCKTAAGVKEFWGEARAAYRRRPDKTKKHYPAGAGRLSRLQAGPGTQHSHLHTFFWGGAKRAIAFPIPKQAKFGFIYRMFGRGNCSSGKFSYFCSALPVLYISSYINDCIGTFKIW